MSFVTGYRTTNPVEPPRHPKRISKHQYENPVLSRRARRLKASTSGHRMRRALRVQDLELGLARAERRSVFLKDLLTEATRREHERKKNPDWLAFMIIGAGIALLADELLTSLLNLPH